MRQRVGEPTRLLDTDLLSLEVRRGLDGVSNREDLADIR